MSHRLASGLLLLLASTGAGAGILRPGPSGLAARYDAFTFVAGSKPRYLYASQTGTLHLFERVRGATALREIATRETWTEIDRLLAADLDRDGQDEIVCTTRDCRIRVLKGTTLDEIWSTPREKYGCISALTVGDIDSDGEPEIVFVADDQLRISSGMQDTDEWRPEYQTHECKRTDIAMGDLDGDGHEEVVLGTGLVLAQPFLAIVWRYEEGFGKQIDLFDVDGDGKPEILGLGADGLLRVFDPRQRRLEWN